MLRAVTYRRYIENWIRAGNITPPLTGGMNEPHVIPLRLRDRLFTVLAVVLAVLLLPVAFVRDPGRARELACHWALGIRFPAEDRTGLTDGARAAFTAARAEALWRHGQLVGLTSGYRDPLVQQRLFDEEVRRVGSPAAARMLVLPPAESRHVKGTALDVRPFEGAPRKRPTGGPGSSSPPTPNSVSPARWQPISEGHGRNRA